MTSGVGGSAAANAGANPQPQPAGSQDNGVMGRLVHTGLGSPSLVVPASTHANSFIIGTAVINSLDNYCRPTKSRSPAGLSTLVYAYVVDCAPASPYAYSSSTHRFPNERTPIEATRLFQRHLRNLVWVWVWVWDWIHWHTSPRTRSPSSRHPPFTHYPFPPRSLVHGGQTSPHKARLVISHST
jgi:hypothetical protein